MGKGGEFDERRRVEGEERRGVEEKRIGEERSGGAVERMI